MNSVPPKRCGRELTPGHPLSSIMMALRAPGTAMGLLRKGPKLAQLADAVAFGPALDDLAVLEPKIVHRRPLGMLSRARDSSVGAKLRAADGAAHMHQV